jgi:hypothetical protein
VSGSAPAGTEVVSVIDSQGNTKRWYKKIETKPVSEPKLTESENKVAYKQGMLDRIQNDTINGRSMLGTNGLLTPEMWRVAKTFWVSNTPYNGDDFDNIFGYLQDPRFIGEFN